MGNCLVLQEKAVRVMMRTNGEILEHKSLIKVDHQVILSKFSHASATYDEHLHAIKTTTTKTTKKKKKVRFSDKVIEGGDQTSGFLRIKVVISKKELQKMLSEGEVSIDGVILKVKNQEITNKVESKDNRDAWLPALESIPEIN